MNHFEASSLSSLYILSSYTQNSLPHALLPRLKSVSSLVFLLLELLKSDTPAESFAHRPAHLVSGPSELFVSVPGCAVLGMKFWWMKPPTLGFPVSIHLAVPAKVPATAWTAWHSLFIYVPLNLLLFWGSFIGLFPLKTFMLMACGLLLPTRSLKMVFLPTVGTYLVIPTTGTLWPFFLQQ